MKLLLSNNTFSNEKIMIAESDKIMKVVVSNPNPSRPNPGRREKINLKFYFHTSLWCLKRF